MLKEDKIIILINEINSIINSILVTIGLLVISLIIFIAV